jgi:hypothetical protein
MKSLDRSGDSLNAIRFVPSGQVLAERGINFFSLLALLRPRRDQVEQSLTLGRSAHTFYLFACDFKAVLGERGCDRGRDLPPVFYRCTCQIKITNSSSGIRPSSGLKLSGYC